MSTLFSIYNRSRTILKSPVLLLVPLLLLAGLGIRLYDLTDLPNDFYLVRQYRGLIMARALYYRFLPDAPAWQRQVTEAQWKQAGLIEPPILESLVALTYRIIGEHIWVGRFYSSLFWVAGALAIWLLAREMNASHGGTLAVAYFLFNHFGIIASRTFMPDPLMVSLILWSIWALYRWEQRRSWQTALFAGLLLGLAILVKSVAVFILLGAAIGMVLSRGSLKQSLADPQAWTIVGLTVVPTLLYYFYGIFVVGTLGGQFALRFFPALIVDPSFYARWLFLAAGLAGFAAFLASLAGIFFLEKTTRWMLLGAWGGYVLFGISFAYHFLTHDYYHLPLLGIVALGLIPLGEVLFEKISAFPAWRQAAVVLILLLAVAMRAWLARNDLAVHDYRHEVAYWKALGERIGHETPFIELSGDYGSRLAYFGWVVTHEWPSLADIKVRQLAGQEPLPFEQLFAEYTQGMRLFVITSLPELDNHPELRDYLNAYYPLLEQSEDGYLIYDLRP
ncbi:MAG: glycosyltransferase family 39 protein [Anaerolineales bacterium]|nr:glycosyltransferase family 39 protein [Anaerolineales bacterium]